MTARRRMRVALFAAVMTAAGCYHKTVSATGFGADRMTVQHPSDEQRVLGYPQSNYKALPTTH